jgi:hypothetical protein
MIGYTRLEPSISKKKKMQIVISRSHEGISHKPTGQGEREQRDRKWRRQGSREGGKRISSSLSQKTGSERGGIIISRM